MKTSSLYRIFSLALLLIFSNYTFAQDGFDDFGGDVPVDGGLTTLIAAGIGYGAKTLRNIKKQ